MRINGFFQVQANTYLSTISFLGKRSRIEATMRYLKKQYKKIVKGLILRKNRFIIHYGSIRIRRKGINITLDERFEKYTKRFSRIILIVNIILIFLVLPAPFNILASVTLILIEQILERVIFSFHSDFIMPSTPSLELWRKASFEAMLLGGHIYRETPGVVGMYFQNEGAAREVFRFVHSWNLNGDEDMGEDGRIRITFVINRKKDKYAVFVSPHMPDKAFEKIQLNQIEKIKQGKEPVVLFAAMVMCKLFNFKGSGLEQFLKYYEDGYQYDFVFYGGTPSNPHPIPGTNAIRKNHLNIKNVEDLTQKDVELFMCKYNIDWDDNSPVPKSLFWYSK